MKIKGFALLAAALVAAVIFVGCKGSDVNTEEFKALKPPEVVNRVITSIRTGETSSVTGLFAAAVDQKILTAFLEKQSGSMDIQSVQVNDKYKESKKIATVQYAYVYIEKSQDKDGRAQTGRKMRKVGTAILVKEDGIWKIRLLDAEIDTSGDKTRLTKIDSELDRKVEEKLFKECVLAVEITKLAEHMYAADNKGEFTHRKELLTRYITDYDSTTCKSLEIDSVGVKEDGTVDFDIYAYTNNMPACKIHATMEKTYPDAFSPKCLGLKPALDM